MLYDQFKLFVNGKFTQHCHFSVLQYDVPHIQKRLVQLWYGNYGTEGKVSGKCCLEKVLVIDQGFIDIYRNMKEVYLRKSDLGKGVFIGQGLSTCMEI